MQQQPMQSSQRQLPPLPRISNQASHPTIPRYQNQIPVRQSSSQQLYQSSGSQMQLQSSGCNSRLSLNAMSSAQSMQSMDSSESMISQQPSQPLLPTQTFPVIFNNVTYMVDPMALAGSSNKFKQLIEPFMNENPQLKDVQLEIHGCEFSNRNMNNFLRLCQSLPTDVENSEMKEICEIAKMFDAEKIYDTGINFVQTNMDPNFNVPDNKYDGSDGNTYMFVECESHIIHHADLDDLNFDDFADMDEVENKDNNKENIDQNTEKEIENKVNATQDFENKENAAQNFVNKENSTQENENIPKKIKSVIYHIEIENHSFKCPVYRFCSDGDVLFTAKQKDNNIYIGNGYDVHINSDTSNHVAHMYQDTNKVNYVRFNDQQFKIKYSDSGKPNQLSLEVTFPYKDKKITWVPKTPKYNAMKNKYYLNFHGEYHHSPIRSRRNIVLQNPKGYTTFIVRKMQNNLFEVECLPVINPLIVFSIGLSDVIGPYIDPLSGF